MTSQANGWTEYRRLVISALERLEKRHDDLVAHVGQLEKEVVALQVKAGIWGFAAGLLPGIATILILALTNRL